MNARTKLAVVTAAVIMAGAIGFLLAEAFLPPLAGTGMQGQSGFYLRAKSVLTTINMAFALILIAGYLHLYSEVKSKFTLGLLFAMFSLFIYAATSNPLVHAFSGFCLSGLGPFTMIPDIFAAAALGILVYLSDM
jgi:hypothetical protein